MTIHTVRFTFTSRLICYLVTGLVLLGGASAAGRDGRKKVTTQAPRLGQSFTLKVGQQVTLEGERLRIKFAALKGDSRCPSDVTCIWAGNAAVRFEVSIRGKDSKSLTLNTSGNGSFPGEALYHGYKLQLVGLNPYPRSTERIAASGYTATLLVSKP